MTSPPYESQPEDEGLSPLTLSTGEASNESALSDAWVTLRKRKWLILGMTLLGILYGFYKAKSQPRLFSATSTIEIRSGSANEFKIGNTGTGTGGNSQIPTQLAILKSNTLIFNVARDLNLANNPNFGGAGANGPQRDINKDPNLRQSIIGSVQGMISVETLPKTDLIRITCNTLDAQLSAAIVNQLVQEYIHYSLQTRHDATQRVTEFFGPQLEDLKNKVETSQGKMIDLQRQLGVLGFDPSLNQVTSNLADLNKAVDTAELARIAAETRYREISGLGHNTNGQSGDATQTSPAVLALRTQLETARASLAQLSANLGPRHPQVLAIEDQISELNKEIAEERSRAVAEARESLNAARAQEDQTRAVLETQQADAFRLRDALVDYTLKQREFDADRLLYEGLREKLRTAGVQAGLESTEIDIVDAAVPPIAPSLKPASSIILVNMLGMLVVSIVLAFVLDSLDTGLRTVGEVEAVSGLPSLALIPRARPNTAVAGESAVLRNLVVLSNPKSQSAEAFRALRTSLLLSVAGGEPQTILLTSATPSEGKTTVSINLACVLAQRDVRVLLIDADLRRPTVHHRFGLNGKYGLTSVLTGSMSLEQTIQKIPELPNLDVLVSGPVPPFPTEMLSSDSMRTLLERCRGIYTHIVMDSPPLLSVTDSIVLARDADAVVLIVRQGKSSKHAVRRARDLLVRSGARITGIALNAVDLNSPEYYSYYGYYGYSSYASEGVDKDGWEPKKSGRGRDADGGKL